MLPFIVEASKLELKDLPNHLKYVYLGAENVVRALKEYKAAIGWTLADIKGISLSICMHRILLEGDPKPSREPQRRSNPTMKEVVMKELLKLLDVCIIYSISDSEWVSPIHVVPKKTRTTMVRNLNNELVPMRVQNGWRMCIDFRKLNQVTRKDPFSPTFHRPNARTAS
ncbi:Retrovirus-related Pol polyprotein from transposon 412 family [Gossypium australe]|uniref:Retrovirus-related Pol polyprotein from transposon 412 family n=1 Tax=Gossypium australe TaxID=47621 RepID=A0A5B6VPN3_9ROSI|nr:Retrovirus-related Pol polyprotein from transposon 412 family [Gossypium australe]